MNHLSCCNYWFIHYPKLQGPGWMCLGQDIVFQLLGNYSLQKDYSFSMTPSFPKIYFSMIEQELLLRSDYYIIPPSLLPIFLHLLLFLKWTTLASRECTCSGKGRSLLQWALSYRQIILFNGSSSFAGFISFIYSFV